MAKSKRHISRRGKTFPKTKSTSYIDRNGNPRFVMGRVQDVLSAPAKIFVEDYLSPKGEKLLDEGKITEKEAWDKYGKKRYKKNPKAYVIKQIVHEDN